VPSLARQHLRRKGPKLPLLVAELRSAARFASPSAGGAARCARRLSACVEDVLRDGAEDVLREVPHLPLVVGQRLFYL